MTKMVQIFELICKPKLLKVLETFFLNPTSRFSQSELIKKTKLAKGTIAGILAILTESRILLFEQFGRAKYYTLNRENFQVKQFKRAYNVTSPLILDFVNRTKELAHKIILFGSFAIGEDRTDSDIDIFVVTDEQEKKIIDVAEKIYTKYKRKITPIVRTPEDYIEIAKKEALLFRKISFEGLTVYEA